MKKIIITIICIILGIILLIFSNNIKSFLNNDTILEEKNDSSYFFADELFSMIYVEIKGDVKRTGVYKVSNNFTLIKLIELAGLTNTSDINNINLAQKLEDGQSYYVPSKVTITSTITISNPTLINSTEYFNQTSISEVELRICINTASLKELMQLPGIGEVRGQKIIDYIKSYGKITSYDILKTILLGIKNADFETIKQKTYL